MATITSNGVTLSQNWGVITFNDYSFGTERMDFQDLMVAVAEKRAVTVEGEVTPMSVRMRDRNKFLDELGSALADLTAAEAALPANAKGSDTSSRALESTTLDTCEKAYGKRPSTNDSKQWLEYHIQMVKSKIDGLNNAAQTDMSRLQSLVDRRDESYSTATNLMTAISDSRSNLIRNL